MVTATVVGAVEVTLGSCCASAGVARSSGRAVAIGNRRRMAGRVGAAQMVVRDWRSFLSSSVRRCSRPPRPSRSREQSWPYPRAGGGPEPSRTTACVRNPGLSPARGHGRGRETVLSQRSRLRRGPVGTWLASLLSQRSRAGGGAEPSHTTACGHVRMGLWPVRVTDNATGTGASDEAGTGRSPGATSPLRRPAMPGISSACRTSR